MAYGLRPYLGAIMGADDNYDPYDVGPYSEQGYHGCQPRYPRGDDDLFEPFFDHHPNLEYARFRGYDEGADFYRHQGMQYLDRGQFYPASGRMLYTISEDMPGPEPDIRGTDEFDDAHDEWDYDRFHDGFDAGFGPYDGVEMGEIDDWDGFDRGFGPYAGVDGGRLVDRPRGLDTGYGPYPGVPMGHLENTGGGGVGWGSYCRDRMGCLQMGYMPDGPWRTQPNPCQSRWIRPPVGAVGLGRRYD